MCDAMYRFVTVFRTGFTDPHHQTPEGDDSKKLQRR